MKLLLSVILLPVATWAQVTVSFSLQPLEVWKGAVGGRLSHTAVYDATVCNAGAQPVVMPAGRIVQAARTRISTVSPLLISGTVARAQSKSAAYRILELVSFAAWGVAVAASANAFAMPENAKIALPLFGEVLAHTADILRSKVPTVDRSAFLDGPLGLAPNACESRLLLGEYRKDVATFQVVIP